MPQSDADRRAAKDLDTIAKAVGLVVLQWGQAEQSLDLVVALLWHSFKEKSHAKKIPMMLEPKVKFVRACMKGDPNLKAFEPQAEALLQRFEALSTLRNDMIHGAVASLSTVDDAFVFAKLDIRDGFHHHREVRIQASDYPKIIDELVALGRDAHTLSAQVFQVAKQSGPIVK